ncbi:ubiquitin-conjugating enzyme E2 Q2-like [Clavelina lepadiformis]|uniref:UBC core domain-containing protein n=1 Tax=Clavelina lepadiformis TaxID=159417 RepID=A0ABP0GQE5_CLALP
MSQSTASLRAELKHISVLFPRSHSVFRVVSSSIDEICCHFVNGKDKHVINCTISESYPQSKPMWYCDTEDISVMQVVGNLADADLTSKYLINSMVKFLVMQLCKHFNLPVPMHIEELDKPPQPVEVDVGIDSSSEDEDDELNDVDDAVLEENVAAEIEEVRKENSGISQENLAILNKIKQTQRKDYISGRVSGSVQASDRLLKELKAIYKSESFKKGCYNVELVNDSLYEWHVQILKVDPESNLHADLKKLKAKNGTASIIMGISFRDNFPFDPPFVRVVCPVLNGGFVLGGGAICMELLTKQGWSSAYSIESLIMQIMATLVKGKARIHFGASESAYSLSKAQQSFQRLVQIHEKNGWFTPPASDG